MNLIWGHFPIEPRRCRYRYRTLGQQQITLGNVAGRQVAASRKFYRQSCVLQKKVAKNVTALGDSGG